MKFTATFWALASTLFLRSCASTGQQCTLTVKNPKKNMCGQRGFCRDFAAPCPVVSRQYVDLATCAGFCADNLEDSFDGCNLISHDNTTNLCTLHTGFTSDAFRTNPNSNQTFYSLDGCFTCKTHNCRASKNANFLKDPNFELSTAFIGPWELIPAFSTGTFTVIRNPVGQGNAIQFETGSTTDSYFDGNINLEQALSLCSKQDYEMNVDFKVEQLMPTPSIVNTTQDGISVGYSIGDTENMVPFTFGDSLLGKWHKLQSSVRGASALQSDGLRVFIDPLVLVNMTWRITVANLRLSHLAASPLKTKGQSVVANGGFESGKLGPWNVDTETLGRFDEIYQGTDPCTAGAPLFDVVSPGLPAKNGIAAASKHRLHYCGIASKYYYAPRSGEFLILTQHVETPTVLDMPYVLTVEYRVVNALLSEVQYGDVVFGTYFVGDNYNQGRGYYMIDPNPTNITTVFQRVITGNGKPALLNLTFTAFSFDPPITRAKIDVDNVSIKPLAT